MRSRQPIPRREQGVALPVMLIILTVLLLGSIYLLRNSNSTTIVTGNLAYDNALSKQADLGLHQAYDWLRTASAANKAVLNASDASQGYVAHLDTTQSPRDAAGNGFWDGSKKITVDASTEIEYVVHRLCKLDGPYDASTNNCVQSPTDDGGQGNQLPFGQSAASDAPQYAGSPMLHFVITARISGARGASVTNQMIVMIGA